MQASATLRFIRVTPRKAMLIANLVRGKSVNSALGILSFSKRKRMAGLLAGLIRSAVANAQNKAGGRINTEQLVIRRLEVGKGPTIKRFRPRAMGRAHNLNKKTCHLVVEVGETLS